MRTTEASVELPSVPARRWVRTGLPLVCVVGAFLVQLVPALAQEARVRGDLPPMADRPNSLLDCELSDAEAARLFARVRQLLLERVGSDRVTDSDLYLGAIQGMLDAVARLDAKRSGPRTAGLAPPGTVLNKDEADLLAAALDGRVTGIGIEFQLHSRPGVIVISRVVPGSPAEAAGLLGGDQVVAIDGRTFAGHGLQTVLGMLQGGAGSSIELEFQRGVGLGAARFVLALQRQAFEVRSVTDELRPGGVGYIRIHQFHRRTPMEVEESLLRLVEMGADRVVLDLRDNPGGDLLAAAGVADLFLPEATVLAHLVEPGVGQEDLEARRPSLFDGELAVLVNGWTLGTAEVVAAALQEHDRAFIIGEPTHGSATVETLIDLGHSLVLRLDSVRVLSPTGKSWAGRGVLPDQAIWASERSQRLEQAGDGIDFQFQTAVHYLQSGGSR